ncbi:MAG TPA: cytochrome c oxidase assembly factor CtaG [Candidatus Salinicoccus stercoripullorum]|uniref:Cytochrome c oxidase assembly factor CtaG n=1 Tax=Candidatus Salinicoccus stercoripullorum TaxID=2838756 RepID=A0A9D1TZ51_9STAP|nr:cytochrome c oxidase assembly factor CtaG [Candidatus Salinicoccus stercoripullorum]
MENISSISIFGFVANWSPYFFLFTAFLTVLYFLLTKKWYRNFENGRPLRVKEGLVFVTSMVLLYIMYGAPVDILSHILFSFHMLQMAVVFLLIAPLMFYAIPEYLWKAFVNLPVARQIFKITKKPLVTLILFNGVFSIYHLPVVLDFLKQSGALHSAFNVLLFLLALLMFYPVFNKVEPKENHMGGLFKMLYVFGIGALLTPACGLIIFAGTPLYETYTDGDAWLSAMELCVPSGVLDGLKGQGLISGPEYFTNTTPIMDQQTGGIIMKVLQEVFFGFMLGFIFFNWFREERMDEEETTRRSVENARIQKELFNQYR